MCIRDRHRVCETIRSLYSNVERLVSNGRKVLNLLGELIFLKTKILTFHLPPAPIVTRWRAWLSSVLYYANDFDSVKSVVDELDKDDAQSIEILQNLLKDSSVTNTLAYIYSNLSLLWD